MEDFPLLQQHNDEQFSACGGLFHEEAMELFSNESIPGFFDAKEDLHLLNWPDQTDPIHYSFGDELDFKFDVDTKPDVFLPDSPILTNALTSPVPIKLETADKKFASSGEKILFPGDVEPLQVSSSIQADSVLKRITQARSVLINGEKEIFGKNIIGLHCLNEIKTSPDKNCQITSTVINGKKYNIIIKSKSSSAGRPVHSTAPAVPQPVKVEPMDQLISELQDGDYDVLGHEDVEDPWALPLTTNHDVEEALDDIVNDLPCVPPPEPLRVPPLRIKIPKPKKVKKHKKRPVLKATSKSRRLHLCEEPPTKIQATALQSPGSPSSLGSSPLSEDSIPLDHDYCSYTRPKVTPSQRVFIEKNPRKDSGLESGGVSDASEESPPSSNPESPAGMGLISTAPILAKELTNKLLEESRRPKNHSHVTKMATALFRATNAVTCGAKLMPPTVTEPTVTVLPHTVAQINCDTSCPSATFPDVEAAAPPPANDRPKKKLKLEEYLNRRNDKESEFSVVAPEAEQMGDLIIDIKEEPVEEPNPMEILEEGEVPCDQLVNSDIEVKVEPKIGEMTKKRDSSDGTTQHKRNSRDIQNDRGKRRRSCDDEHRRACSYGSRDVRAARRNSRISSTSSAEDRVSKRRTSRSRAGSAGRERRRRYRTRSKSRSSSLCSSSSSCGSSRRRSSLNSLRNFSRYRRRTRTRSRSPYRSRSRDNSRCHPGKRRNQSSYRQLKRARSRSPIYSHREKQRQIDERRVVYVGRIAEGTTNHSLRQRFSIFGPIIDISLHFREHGDNYGFVTFAYKDDAYQAVEHGNDNPALTQLDLSFGGRRSFCKQRYSDLDGMPISYSGFNDAPLIRSLDGSFDLLLKQAKAKLHMRKDAT